jgi:hypothetical protein
MHIDILINMYRSTNNKVTGFVSILNVNIDTSPYNVHT